jgi:hypothetical protein
MQPFTCDFTVKDLETRWFSMLYDPEVAAEVAVDMIAVEHGFNLKPSKKTQAGAPPRSAASRIELASDL